MSGAICKKKISVEGAELPCEETDRGHKEHWAGTEINYSGGVTVFINVTWSMRKK